MRSTQGQKYIQNFFFKGLMADIDSEMITDPTGVLEAHCMHLSNKARNIIKKLPGDKEFVELEPLGDQVFTGAVWLTGYVVEFWRDIEAGYTNIYANGLLIAQHADLPGDPTHMLDIDTCDETKEMFITDNKQCPIVLDLQDMLDNYATTTYFTDYDKTLYEINRPVDLSQPMFKQLEEMGAGNGLKAGSYAYAMRFSNVSGEKTPWGPVSPYIPVPYDTKSINGYNEPYSSVIITGQAPSTTPTKFGIRLRLHINNQAGFDYIELRRYANYTGQPISYTPISEYLILGVDAFGAAVDIKTNSNTVLDFIDTDSIEWAVLDESEVNTYSTIKRARTIRYYDKRIVLGGVEYESKLVPDKDVFINHADVDALAFPFIEQLDYEGYGDMQNQVFKKSHRLGERYGFAAKFYDDQGNVLYAVPLKNDTQDFTNYRFPNRRSVIPVAERSYSPDAQNISTIFSYDPLNANRTNYVYEPIESMLIQKWPCGYRNIVDKEVAGTVYDYHPMTPTGVDPGYGGNGSKFSGLDEEIMTFVDGFIYGDAVSRHGIYKSAVGLTIGGIDTTKLPSFVKSFSIVRTPAAGRVVCQGIAMYALTQQGYYDSPSLTKALNKVWFYSPEIDENIGDKSGIFDDMRVNPSNYQVQLISPVGFFTDVYSGGEFTGISTITDKIDMISHAIMGGNDVHLMEPIGLDLSTDIGAGEGRVTFGRFRNSPNQGSGITDYNLTFDLSAASEPSLNAIGDINNRSRTPYLELTLGSNIYAYTDVDAESGDTVQSRRFHEPWYIVNIIKEDAEVANNNINIYNDIGHYIKLESTIGISNGESDQIFELVEERIEDVYGQGETIADYRYIYVNGLPWLDGNNLNAGRLTSYQGLLESVGYFTPLNGDTVCYGLYLAVEDSTSTGPRKYISFPYSTNPSSIAICPTVGDDVVVRYNNNSPIELFLGDTYVHDALFAPIDCNLDYANTPTGPYGFNMNAPMPYFEFMFNLRYLQPRDPEGGSSFAEVFEEGGPDNAHEMEYIRQWLVSFGCESSVNLPFIYKNYFPNRNYVMRPAIYNKIEDTETVDEYLDDVYIYSYYDTDYPNEHLNWGYGGFHLPIGSNWDYEKRIHSKVFTEPSSGVNETLTLMKRIHWSTQGITGYPSSKSFIPTNIYDLKNDKASQISILYDVFSDKGNNLYVITDRGVGLLLTDKQMITDAGGNSLAILASDSSLVQGELWLNQGIGCPREFWRGKSEGNVKLPNNIKVPILMFPSYNDIVMLSANNFVELADNNREKLTDAIKTIDLTRDFITNLYSVVDEGENNIWVVIDDTTYLFNIDSNNWCAHVVGFDYVKSLYAPYLNGVDDRNVLAHIIGGDNILSPATTAAPTTTAAY